MNRNRLGAIISLVYLAALWYMARPGHTDPAPPLWHGLARVFGAVARLFGSLALTCEWRYWQAVGA